jgi:hypothetical protein
VQPAPRRAVVTEPGQQALQEIGLHHEHGRSRDRPATRPGDEREHQDHDGHPAHDEPEHPVRVERRIARRRVKAVTMQVEDTEPGQEDLHHAGDQERQQQPPVSGSRPGAQRAARRGGRLARTSRDGFVCCHRFPLMP